MQVSIPLALGLVTYDVESVDGELVAQEHVPLASWCEGLSHRELGVALGSWAASLDATRDYPSLAQLLREAARRIGGDAL
jgi:hypothetical protein